MKKFVVHYLKSSTLDKCEGNFDKLSYMELTNKLELEKESIKNNILEFKKQ